MSRKIENPLISVLIPVYKHEKFIDETIRSILAQTYSNWELIIVDDKSPDGSWKIIQKYAKHDIRIKAFRNKINKGLVPNWEFMINKSKGKYIAFLEGDDIYYKNNLKNKVKIFEKYPEVGMVYCNFKVIDEHGYTIVKNHNLFQHVPTYINEYINPYEYLSSKYHLLNSYGQIMIRRTILKKTGYPRSLDKTEKIFLPSDWDFNFRISTRNKIYYLDNVLFGYRKHSSNNSYDTVKAYKHMSLLLNEYEDTYSNDTNILKAIQYKRSRCIYSNVIYYLEIGDKANALNEFISYIKISKLPLKDIDLNVKLIIRLLLPNRLNNIIKNIYYHQTSKKA